MTRISGISVPLFSLRTTRSWGIGEFGDFVDFARWAAEAGQSVVQILPIMELPLHERSPYSALSSFALDPSYITIAHVPDYTGPAVLGPRQALLDAARQAGPVAYDAVRTVKHQCLFDAWGHFQQAELAGRTERAHRFDAFCQRESGWLDDYALFAALLERFHLRAWWEWPAAYRHRDPAALAAAARELAVGIGYRKYMQWIADTQWADARRLAGPMRVYGDLPFMISANSADVWCRQDQFRLDATIGAPPDAFAAEGQDWGLPPWRWRVMRQRDFEWFRARARRHADLFDGFRIDHLVGLYRTWTRPVYKAQPPFFDPADERTQQALGEALVGIFTTSGAAVIAEDLGTVPPFVRASITRLGVPGFKVLRWERHWDQPGEPAIDPATFPPLSVATTGTHDVEPLAATMSQAEARTTVETLMAAGSSLTLLPLQDAFGWTARINTPAVVNDVNWTWTVPAPVDTWAAHADAAARQRWLRELSMQTGRLGVR